MTVRVCVSEWHSDVNSYIYIYIYIYILEACQQAIVHSTALTGRHGSQSNYCNDSHIIYIHSRQRVTLNVVKLEFHGIIFLVTSSRGCPQQVVRACRARGISRATRHADKRAALHAPPADQLAKRVAS